MVINYNLISEEESVTPIAIAEALNNDKDLSIDDLDDIVGHLNVIIRRARKEERKRICKHRGAFEQSWED